MSWAIVIAVLLAGLFFSALYSGAETGLYCVRRARVHVRAQEGERSAIYIDGVLNRQQDALFALLVGTNVMNFITTYAVSYAIAVLLHAGDAATQLYTIVLLTPVVFVFGEVVPKTLFQRHSYLWLSRSIQPLRGTMALLRYTGILWALRSFTAVVSRIVTGGGGIVAPLPPRRRMARLIQDALTGRTTGEHQSYLVDRVMQLSEMPLHAAMIPRNRIVSISDNATRQQFLRIVRKTAHRRLPVTSAENANRVVGVATIDELLMDETWETVADRIAAPFFLSPHIRVSAALSELQSNAVDMAIVTDRGGRTLGVVTLHGLLEEFMGDLAVGVDSDNW